MGPQCQGRDWVLHAGQRESGHRVTTRVCPRLLSIAVIRDGPQQPGAALRAYRFCLSILLPQAVEAGPEAEAMTLSLDVKMRRIAKASSSLLVYLG